MPGLNQQPCWISALHTAGQFATGNCEGRLTAAPSFYAGSAVYAGSAAHGGALLQLVHIHHSFWRTLSYVQPPFVQYHLQAARYMRAVLRTVARCHNANILHRDIKPGNFMLASGNPKAPLKAIGAIYIITSELSDAAS